MSDYGLGFSSSNSKTYSAITYMDFLKSFFPQKSFLKYPFLILHIKTVLQANFYMVSKFTEHLQHFSDVDRLFKQIKSDLTYLKLSFSSQQQSTLLIPCDLRRCQILLNNINIFRFFSMQTGNLIKRQILRNRFPILLQVS